MTSTDEFMIGICAEVAQRMTETGLPGTELKEKKHLDPMIKDAIGAQAGIPPVSKKFDHPLFVGLGAVDVVADRPKLFAELKWSYGSPRKAFESVWDAIKLAMLGSRHGRSDLYIATGASEDEWRDGACADLFETGAVNPLEMWERRLKPRGPNGGATVGADLVIGGKGNQPTQGPRQILVTLLGSFPVSGDFLLKLIRLEGTTDLQPWPQIAHPEDTSAS